MNFLKEKLSSQNLKERIIYSLFIFFVLFISITILSYYILPQGILKGKIPSSNLEVSNNLAISTLRIFAVNLMSVIFIFIGSLFNQKRNGEKNYYSIAYNVFFMLISINAITLGTWSFSVETQAPSLIDRLLGMFNIIKRAGLWEIIGQLLITCSISHIGLLLTNDKETITRNIKSVKLSKSEIVCIILGFIFMLIGALVESIAI